MAHEIEQFTDGTAAFATARVSAWHGLGVRTEGAMTAEEAMRLASLDGWNVRKVPLTATEITPTGAESIEVPQHFASVRTHPKTGRPETLGVVGTDFCPMQNEEHAEFLNTLADESGAHFETAGSLKNGRQVFLTMKLPQTMTVAGSDRTDLYIVASNSHDGNSKFRVVTTPIRVVCANTERAAFRGAPSVFAVSHTAGAKGRIAQARQALGLTFKYAEEFEKAAERMVQAELTLTELQQVVDQAFPMTHDGKVAQANQRKRRAAVSNLFLYGENQAGIRGTRWAGYNAITEYVNHVAPARGTKTEQQKAATRAERIITGTADAPMEKAFALLTV
ncbi:DUF932 domain-containing protein [Streptomyces sp. NBC_00401]|uniref:DUF932 domain-containing protein n=1 Tax=Streptomyces sp. NBC_00401 TaxID=2975738 RepID=UPI00225BD208|nr:DUF932 domain-containing protein [Streptomyces sp. NBC_00401]MCX5083695.1 DUF945 domain-containing protein [Streptomyces sp. NBC_00401]